MYYETGKSGLNMLILTFTGYVSLGYDKYNTILYK